MNRTFRKERARKPALSFQEPNSRFRDGEELEVTIEKLVWGGAGLARTDRGVIFVDFAAPGDVLRVKIDDVAKDYARARIQDILKPSVDRIDPKCPVFGRCGGCDWQHLTTEKQLATKIELLRESLERHADYRGPIEAIPSPKAWNYRNRIQVHLDAKGPYYHAKRSHQPVHMRDCPIAEDEINRQLRELKPLSATAGSTRVTAERLQLSSGQPPQPGIDAPLSFEFAQVNTAQNVQMVERVLHWAAHVEFERFFDLYSGSGNFSFPMSEKFPKARGTAVELNPLSVRSAQEEAQRRKWGRNRVEFFAGSVDALMPRLPVDENALVILDPPRAGLGKGVADLLSKTPAASILYVSCDPPGLVRDLKRLMQNGKWKIHRLTAFDMFPQTAHLEVLTELRPIAPN